MAVRVARGTSRCRKLWLKCGAGGSLRVLVSWWMSEVIEFDIN